MVAGSTKLQQARGAVLDIKQCADEMAPILVFHYRNQFHIALDIRTQADMLDIALNGKTTDVLDVMIAFPFLLGITASMREDCAAIAVAIGDEQSTYEARYTLELLEKSLSHLDGLLREVNALI